MKRIYDFVPENLKNENLERFFQATVEQLYSKPSVKHRTGFIGGYINVRPGDVYLDEINEERKIHQFSQMILFDGIARVYDDLVQYVKNHHGNVEDHERLFREKFYSWHPPIDLDAFVNFRNYYWVLSPQQAYVLTDVTDLDSLIGSSYASVPYNSSTLDLSSGMIVEPRNDVNPKYNGKRWIVEGVGRAIIFVEDRISIGGWDVAPWDTTPWDFAGDILYETPDYITMERGCRDGNLWSRTNRWFHRDVIPDFENVRKIQASRPVVIFDRDLLLWNHGWNYRGKVDVVVDCREFFDLVNGLTDGLSSDPFANTNLDCHSKLFYSPIWPGRSSGFSEVAVVDIFGNLVKLRDNMRILFANSSDPVNGNRIYVVQGIASSGTIYLVLDTFGTSGSGIPNYGDFVEAMNGTEYEHVWFDGSAWKVGQTKKGINQEPLFELFDIEKNLLSSYNNSSFRGSRIFGYRENPDSPIDPVLGKRLSYSKKGKIEFENYLHTERYTYDDPVTGERKVIHGDYFWYVNSPFEHLREYGNNWHLSPEESRQYVLEKHIVETDGNSFQDLLHVVETPLFDNTKFFDERIIVRLNGRKLEIGTDYTVSGRTVSFSSPLNKGDFLEIRYLTTEKSSHRDLPLNLTHNPLNEDVSIFTLDDVFFHFTTNIRSQPNFSGNPYGRNNYRDQPRERWRGKKILKHTSPLPIMAFLAGSPGIHGSVDFVRREYQRFRTKFLAKLDEYHKKSFLPPIDPVQWIEKILEELKLGKNDSFPFHNSGVYDPEKNLFIPPSPSFLGILPLHEPGTVSDDLLSSGNFLRCHDGSWIPSYGDFRDSVILEFERGIYNSSPISSEKEKLHELLTWYDVVPGKWRKTDYSRSEIVSILEKFFNNWLVENGIVFEEYNDEDGYFGLDYINLVDWQGDVIPCGHWRGVYRYYFDCDRPDLRPWEMLGFPDKPSWWDAEYGPPPYTRNNVRLWTDLENGLIRNGPRAGIDPRFARPGLRGIIPVDDYGRLLDPVSCGVVRTIPPYRKRKLVFGDGGKIETLWYLSDDFPFAVVLLLFLTRPAVFSFTHFDSPRLELFMNEGIGRTSPQYVFRDFRSLPVLSELIFHNEKEDVFRSLNLYKDVEKYQFIHENYVRNYGYQQFVSDWLKRIGRGDITENFGKYLRSASVVMSWRVSGFTRDYKIFTETFGKVSDDNVHLAFHESEPFDEFDCTALIVERHPLGFRIRGYNYMDRRLPYHEPVRTSGFKIIGFGTDETPIPSWQPLTSYKKGDIVVFHGRYYKATRDFVSGKNFDRKNWIEISYNPDYLLKIKEYRVYSNDISWYPYGRILGSIQEVADVVLGYQEFLSRKGVEFLSDEEGVVDFRRSIVEFLAWVSTVPEIEEFIILSPFSMGFDVREGFGTVEDLTKTDGGIYPVLNKYGKKIKPSDIIVGRKNGTGLSVRVKNWYTDESSLIHYARIRRKIFEHILWIDNTTVFGDVVYVPLYASWLERVFVDCVVSEDWKGFPSVSGFFFIGENIEVNYENMVDRIRFIYDIPDYEKIGKLLAEYSWHNVGFQKLSYMENLLFSTKVQMYFYLGLVKHKGTRLTVDNLLKSYFLNRNINVEIFEEWAFFKNFYGNIENRPELVFEISKDNIVKEPHIIRFSRIDLEDTVNVVESESLLPLSSADSWYYVVSSRTFVKYENGIPVSSSGDEFITEITSGAGKPNLTDIPALFFDGNPVHVDRRILTPIYMFEESYANENWLFTGVTAGSSYPYVLPHIGFVREDEVDHVVWRMSDFDGKSVSFTTGNFSVWVMNTEDFGRGRYVDWNVYRFLRFTVLPNSVSTHVSGSEVLLVFDMNVPFSGPPVGIFENDHLFVRISSSNDLETLTDFYEVAKISGSEIFTSVPEGFFGLEISDVSAFVRTSDFAIWLVEEMRYATLEEMEFRSLTLDIVPVISSDPVKRGYIDDGRDSVERTHGRYPVWKVVDYDGSNFTVVRERKEEIDSRKFDSLIVRNPKTGEPLRRYEVYNPLQGTLFLEIEKNIDYIGFVDPAVYNVEFEGFEYSDGREWGREKVGKTWWNLRNARFYMYLMDNERDYWGKLHPSSKVNLYVWVESENPPSSYTGPGRPWLGNGTPYSTARFYDEKKRTYYDRYWFWVEHDVPLHGRETGKKIESILRNPELYGYYAPVDRYSIIIAGAKRILSSGNHVEFSWRLDETDWLKHSDWILGRENDPSWLPDRLLWKKMKDSLVGFDEYDRDVPDSRLPFGYRYGMGIRPSQSLVVRRREARRNMVTFLNEKLKRIRFELLHPTSVFDRGSPYPHHNFIVNTILERDSLLSNPSLIDGDLVLVRNTEGLDGFWTLWRLVDKTTGTWELHDIQRYRLSDFVRPASFYEEGIDPDNIPSKVVQNIAERNDYLSRGLISDGEIVVVLDDGSGLWEWQRYDAFSGNFITVARENATVEFSEKFYTNEIVIRESTDFSGKTLEEISDILRERDGSLELSVLLDMLYENNGEFLGPLLVNRFFFEFVRFSLTDLPPGYDWCFKTSYVQIGNIFEEIGRNVYFNTNLFESFIRFFQEAKPYHTKVRDIERVLRIRTEEQEDSYRYRAYDYEYGTPEYDAEKNRKIEISLYFDRVSCSPLDIPEYMIFPVRLDKSKYKPGYDVEVRTIPVRSSYDPNEHIEYWMDVEFSFHDLEGRPKNVHYRIYRDIVDGKYTVDFLVHPGEGTVKLKRRITRAERVDFYYQSVGSNIFGEPYVEPQPEKDLRYMTECYEKSVRVEGGNFDLDPAFIGVVVVRSVYGFDPYPDSGYFESVLDPPTTPDGMDMNLFKLIYGSNWWEEYIRRYQTVDPYLISFAETYGFGRNRFDEIPPNLFLLSYPSAASTVSGFYEYLIEGTSSPNWINVSGVLDSLIEGYRFVQPRYDSNHPPELVPQRMFDVLTLVVDRHASNPSPLFAMDQRVVQNLSSIRIELSDRNIPVTRDGLLIFVDGELTREGNEYVFDYTNLVVDLKLSGIGTTQTNIHYIDIRTISVGGSAFVVEDNHYFAAEQASANTFWLIYPSAFDLSGSLTSQPSGLVVLSLHNGRVLDDQIVSGNEITVSSSYPVDPSDVFSFYIAHGSGISYPVRTVIPYNTIPFSAPLPISGVDYPPLEKNYLIFNNRRIVCPPHMFFMISPSSNIFVFRVDNDGGLVGHRFFVDGVQVVSSSYEVTANASGIVVSSLFTVNSGSLVSFLAYISGEYDYRIEISGNELVLLSSPNPTGTLDIIWFENPSAVSPVYSRHHFQNDYDTLVLQFSLYPDSLIVGRNGFVEFRKAHYDSEIVKAGWDVFPWDTIPWDSSLASMGMKFSEKRRNTCIFRPSLPPKIQRDRFVLVKNDRENYYRWKIVDDDDIWYTVTDVSSGTTFYEVSRNLASHPAKRFDTDFPLVAGHAPLTDVPHILCGYREIDFYGRVSSTVLGWEISKLERGLFHTPIDNNIVHEKYLFVADDNTTKFDLPFVPVSSRLKVSRIVYTSVTSYVVSSFPYNGYPVGEVPYVMGIDYRLSGRSLEFFTAPSAQVGCLFVSVSTCTSANYPNILVIYESGRSNLMEAGSEIFVIDP